MTDIKKVTTRVVLLAIAYLVAVGFILRLTFSYIDKPAVSAIIGALVGSLGVVIGAALSGVVALWNRSTEDEQRLKDQASRQALELTRMDYELRQKALQLTGKRRQFLAPTKVYRELYRAILQLHTTGEWPDTPYQLGLLNIFELGAEDDPSKKQS